MTGRDVEKAIDEIWKLFRETDQRSRETEEKLAKELRERDERLDKELRERDERMGKFHLEMVEGFRELKELFKETDQRFKETAQQMKETDQKIRELNDLFTSQWGKLIEALIAPGSVINVD